MIIPYSRRHFLRTATLSGLALSTPGVFADLVQTPRQVEGPFYPDKLPLDTDNDLIIVNDSLTPAVGSITHLHGKILDIKGSPVRNALVEIWQVGSKGAYIHTGDARNKTRDPNFQGFGRFLTNSKGEYYFRTVKPVPYTGRTPHIHVAVKIKGKKRLITQCYIKGEDQNTKDRPLSRVKDRAQRESLIVDFAPLKNSRIGELQARFDIVLGFTPEDTHKS